MKIWKLLSFDLWQNILTNGRTSDKGLCEKGMGLVNSPHLRRISNKNRMMKMHKMTMRGFSWHNNTPPSLSSWKILDLRVNLSDILRFDHPFGRKVLDFTIKIQAYIWWPALILPYSLIGFENKLWNN